MKTTLFLYENNLLCWKEGVVWLYKGRFIMMKGFSFMDGENSVGVPFDS